MADPHRSPETREDTDLGAERGQAAGTRRWVFVIGIIAAIAVVALMVLLHLTGILGPGAH